ncbi:MAG TPA: type II toxin-antitoxin system HicA family toxin [Candidatus Avalokitesvara rifleensis]|uniref:type II toxin-antitoxin system HicA family toxin n=1 Tax=Candidatus Avalokitesvara rifleensis TaxID=3367620 RepID=UPI004029904A
MSPYLPQIKARDLVRIAQRLGFEFDRQSGSHAIYIRKKDKLRVVIPNAFCKGHKTKDLTWHN